MRDENLSQLHTITACESGTLPELERTPKANWDTPKATWDTPKATWDTRAKSAARPTEQSWPSTRSVQADARRRASLSAGCRPPMPLRPTTWLVLLPRRGAHDTRLAVFGWRTLLNNRTHAAGQPLLSSRDAHPWHRPSTPRARQAGHTWPAQSRAVRTRYWC